MIRKQVHNPLKKNQFHFVAQWSGVQNYGVALAGLSHSNELKLYHNMEDFGPYSNEHNTLVRRLVASPRFFKYFTKNFRFLQNYCLNRTSFKDLEFDDNFNNIVIFEGTYFPKTYLGDWKEKNNLIFIQLISDIIQFSPNGKQKIEFGHNDKVISFFDPPDEFAGIVDYKCDIPAPYFDQKLLLDELNSQKKEWLAQLPENIDIFFSAASTPIRDQLVLPFWNQAIKNNLETYIVYSDLEADLSPFSHIAKNFPNETGYLDPFQNNYLASRCNCLLEIFKTSVATVTDRYRKAVIYNKKFICNNPNIKDLDFYNANWMRIVETPQDITDDLLSWAAKKETINYKYDGRWEFSNTVLRAIEDIL